MTLILRFFILALLISLSTVMGWRYLIEQRQGFGSLNPKQWLILALLFAPLIVGSIFAFNFLISMAV